MIELLIEERAKVKIQPKTKKGFIQFVEVMRLKVPLKKMALIQFEAGNFLFEDTEHSDIPFIINDIDTTMLVENNPDYYGIGRSYIENIKYLRYLAI